MARPLFLCLYLKRNDQSKASAAETVGGDGMAMAKTIMMAETMLTKTMAAETAVDKKAVGEIAADKMVADFVTKGSQGVEFANFQRTTMRFD